MHTTPIYTIGHSNRDTASLLKLLKDNGIQVLVDVRSAPYSRYVPQFIKQEIEAEVVHAGLQYIFMGDLIGGKPSDPEYQDEDGRARYDTLAASEKFQQGM
ncbi:MAG: DUF488 domain-containing protein, partial [Deltaproteobacteria bacterium]|nr:DUF488 domain-containing protein [Deltaproteobacteria bacterium]